MSSLIKQTEVSVEIWDLPIRLFHWLLVLLFIAAYVTNSLGPDYFVYHVWSGYALIVLVLFRVIWGFCGSHHARFKHFISGPKTSILYLIASLRNREKHYPGHNPLGAWMILFFLLASFVQGITGLFANDEIFNTGPLYAYVTNETSLSFTSVHKELFYWMLGAVALHIFAVLIHVFIKKDNLIKAMFTGKKNLPVDQKDEINIAQNSNKLLLALAIILVLVVVLLVVVFTAPTQSLDSGY